MGGMKLEEGANKVKVGGEDRVIKQGKRKDGKSTLQQKVAKSDALLKQNMKRPEEMGGQGDSDWESAEEDAPAVRLEELLGNMKLEGDDSEKEEENKESAE